jgi:hypothetical protein
MPQLKRQLTALFQALTNASGCNVLCFTNSRKKEINDGLMG